MGIKEIQEKIDYGKGKCPHCYQTVPARLTQQEDTEYKIFLHFRGVIIDRGINFLSEFYGYCHSEMEKNTMKIFDKIKHKLSPELRLPEITQLCKEAWVELGGRLT